MKVVATTVKKCAIFTQIILMMMTEFSVLQYLWLPVFSISVTLVLQLCKVFADEECMYVTKLNLETKTSFSFYIVFLQATVNSKSMPMLNQEEYVMWTCVLLYQYFRNICLASPSFFKQLLCVPSIYKSSFFIVLQENTKFHLDLGKPMSIML